ncbi:uncharacterized protein LOC111698647 [Eurytemora carolleeae]|uniref:uncharacterized protein LOC111698647 n=1 Tax=Eurytemora carolleeae TaxID=1294199 RepID=UPI000C7662E3|nr:uncharacterized protein LOC111698647 [Eurytemora carolleeae]|eukprot:XP_023324800.1 uncharacterized protein LOC111698647 [Eurytemora affinis]
MRSIFDLRAFSAPVVLIFGFIGVLYFTSSSSNILQPSNSGVEGRLGEDGVVRDCRTWEPRDYTPATDNPNIKKAELTDAEKHENRLKSWENDWKNQIPESPKSGFGSTIEVTKNMRKSLETITNQLKKDLGKETIRFLDCPSGDMTWMPLFLRSRTDVIYSGYDLIPANIDMSKANFSKEPWVFKQFDMMKDRIEDSFDLVLNRHVSIHLGLLDSIQMFYNMMQSGSKYLITTTFPDVTVNDPLKYSNQEVSGRSFHQVNLHLYPFHFPTPICINEDAPAENQHLALWRISDLKVFFEENKDKFRPFQN